MGDFIVEVVPYASDNYSYLLLSKSATALIDCGDSATVLARLKALGRTLDAILICHAHADHTAGAAAVMRACPNAALYTPVSGSFAHGIDKGRVNIVTEGFRIHVGGGDGEISITALSVPAHTKKCVNYYADNSLFTSDTLFSAGCGRLFEGTAKELAAAMDRLKAYPPETNIYFGHEYTRSNLKFALSVEPGNPDIKEYIKEVDSIIAAGGVTTPSTVGRELRVNPFFRIDSKAVAGFVDPAGRYSETERMGLLREAKDRF